jgi:hypothetical protein
MWILYHYIASSGGKGVIVPSGADKIEDTLYKERERKNYS